jgi:hypothetical protein
LERPSIKLDAGKFQSVGPEFFRQGDYSVGAIDVPPVQDHIQGERPTGGPNQSSGRQFVIVDCGTRHPVA